MNRLRLSDVSGPVARALGYCDTDITQIASYVNRACQRLLYGGFSPGSWGRFRVCLSDGCITLPRYLENVEAFAVEKLPGDIRDDWFEFLDSGPGIVESDRDIGNQMLDRGEACAFDDVTGSNKLLAVFADATEATTSGGTQYINVQYKDSGGNWVRTQFNGAWIEGENIPLVKGEYRYSSRNVAPYGLARVVKPVTNGMIRLYSYDTTTASLKALGAYEPSEEVPVYRRYTIPGLADRATDGSDCEKLSVVLAGRLKWLPVIVASDFLQIGHPDAVRLMCQAIQKEENNLIEEASAYEATARRVLDDYLKHYRGSGVVRSPRKLPAAVTGPAVENIIG